MPEFYEDIVLPCAGKDCPNGGTFTFTGGQQKYLRELEANGALSPKGLPVTYKEPRRCKECREAKKKFFDARDAGR